MGYNHSVERYLSINQLVDDGFFRLNSGSVGLVTALRVPDDYFSLGYRLSYSNYWLKNATGRSFGFETGVSNAFSFQITLARNSIDNPTFPTRGSLISLSAEMTPPISWFTSTDIKSLPPSERYRWIEYHKWLLDVKSYLPVVEKLVFEARFHTGFLGRYSSRSPSTPFERFIWGGAGQGAQNFILGSELVGLRGYREGRVIPAFSAERLQGGAYYVKTVFELRYPVFSMPAGTGELHLFYEAGNNWNEPEEYNFFNLYRSLGFGVRVSLPALGVISIDWGYPLDLLPGETTRSGRLLFTLGTTFR